MIENSNNLPAFKDDSVLTGLNDIEWDKLDHAYGTAEDTPYELRRLVGAKSYKTKKEALKNLQHSVYHQDGLYSASPVVMPFLLRILKSECLKGKLQEELFDLICDLSATGSFVWDKNSCFHPDNAYTRLDGECVAIRKTSTAYFSGEIEYLLLLLKNGDTVNLRCQVSFALAWLTEHSALVLPALQDAYLYDKNVTVKMTALLSMAFVAKVLDSHKQDSLIEWIYKHAPQSKQNKLWPAFTVARLYWLEDEMPNGLYKDILLLVNGMFGKHTLWGGSLFDLGIDFLVYKIEDSLFNKNALLWDIWNKHVSLHYDDEGLLFEKYEWMKGRESCLIDAMLECFFKEPFYVRKSEHWFELSTKEKKQVKDELTGDQLQLLGLITKTPSSFDNQSLSYKLSSYGLPREIDDLVSFLGWLPETKLADSIKRGTEDGIKGYVPELSTFTSIVDLIKMISLHLPLTQEMLYKFKSVLDWEQVSKNRKVNFDYTILSTFKDEWYWYLLVRNMSVGWDVDTVLELREYTEKYIDDILCADEVGFGFDEVDKVDDDEKWSWISQNETIEWTEGLVEEYKNKLDWYDLSCNKSLPWSLEFIQKYQRRLDFVLLSSNLALPWSEELLNKYKTKWCAVRLSGNDGLPWTEQFVERHVDSIDWLAFTRITNFQWTDEWFAENVDRFAYSSDWANLSKNVALPWSKEFIENYKDKWCWYELSLNTAVPWSYDLMEAFADKLYWNNLMLNTGIHWNDELLTLLLEHKEHLKYTTYSFPKKHSFPWDLELANNPRLRKMLTHEDPVLYENVVAPFLNEGIVCEILSLYSEVERKVKQGYLSFFYEHGPKLNNKHPLYSALKLI